MLKFVIQVDRYDVRFAGDWEINSACLDIIHKVKAMKTTFEGKQRTILFYVHNGNEI